MMPAHPFVDREVSHSPQIEPTLPLINIVFLLLIFFMIAGSFQLPLMDSIETPTQTLEVEGVAFEPQDWLYVTQAGDTVYRGQALPLSDLSLAVKDGQSVLFADGELVGRDLSTILKALEASGAERVMLITERETAR